MDGERFTCTAEKPWKPEYGPRAMHPDAIAGDEHDYGGGEYCVSYNCPHCGKCFEVELAQ